MNKWKRSTKGYMTPGGDPVWECPNCGAEHVYGIETQGNYKNKCDKCGIKLEYPWEDAKNTEDIFHIEFFRNKD